MAQSASGSPVMHGHNDNIHAGANSPPVGQGPFQKLSSMKTRSGELPRRQASSQTGGLSPQASGGSFPHAHQTPFSHSSSWGPRGTPHGAVQGGLASASSGPVGYRGATPATPPQQPGQEPPATQQVSCILMFWFRDTRIQLASLLCSSFSIIQSQQCSHSVWL